MTDLARQVAYDVVSGVTSRGAYANLLLTALLREHGLGGKDAALATELVYGTLRGRGSYDAVIALCADRDVAKIDPPVLDALRLGAHQLLGMRIKPHAAVATTVDLAVEAVGRRSSGFVNAVLRRMTAHDLAGWLAIAVPDRAGDPMGYLAVTYSHPRWIVAAFAAALGETEADLAADPASQTEAALAADGDRPLVTLAATPGLSSAADLVAAGAKAARWSPLGGYLPGGDPARVPAVADGRAGVQDEASQLAVLALTRAQTAADAGTGADRAWLDLCAGPGGKARLLAGLAAERGAVLVAADAHEHRARLAAGALRPAATLAFAAGAGATRAAGAGAAPSALGGHARAVTADGLAGPWRPGTFDRVLADVPCSGLGSLRRRPEARWRRGPGDVARLGLLQRGLLAAAVEATRPGGVIAYVTCSPHLAETVQVVDDVLAGRDDITVLDVPALLPEVPDLRCRAPHQRYAQFWPHRHGTDAIFVALMQRTGAPVG